jgi:hypothetical protein
MITAILFTRNLVKIAILLFIGALIGAWAFTWWLNNYSPVQPLQTVHYEDEAMVKTDSGIKPLWAVERGEKWERL